MDNAIDVNMTGVNASDRQGFSVASAGDVNGDGYDDVIVGANGNDGNGVGSGAAFVYFGGASMDNAIDINLTGVAASDQQGVSVAPAGDVNGDGYDDVIVGANLNDGNGASSGAAFVYFGGASMDNAIDVNLTGVAAGDQQGISVAPAGDVNGDGYDDVIVNGDGYDDVIVGSNLNYGNGAESGAAFVYFGGASMNNGIDVNLTGVLTGDNQGVSVASAGDVNGDGYDDVIVGANFNDGNGASSGAAFVYFGGASMDNAIDVNMTGVAANDQQGISVAPAGDVNGDGYDDVIVGANGNDGNGGGSGAGFVYLGYGLRWGSVFAQEANLQKGLEIGELKMD
ncbi:MAG: FG-GAP repeat protein, partial [Candidatus Sungbacteria bacterium]|nr:FG-GAP repeat protein [Candidatus Sungbacteria bacterium]